MKRSIARGHQGDDRPATARQDGETDADITALVPKTDTSPARPKGRYSKAVFRNDAKPDEYICPAGERLTKRHESDEKGKTLWVYWTDRCGFRPLKADCTTGKERRIKRWEKEDVLDKAATDQKQERDAMRQRKALVEHPLGTLKQGMGATHFLVVPLSQSASFYTASATSGRLLTCV